MVTVPLYQQTTELRPQFRQGVDVQASPDAFGAAIGRGMVGAAQGVSQVADAMRQVQDLNDEARAREQRNAYMKERDLLLYDPENGYLNSMGKNAIDGRASFTQRMTDLRKKYAEGLTPQQSSLFNRSVEPLEMDANRAALQHNAGQLKEYVITQGVASASAFGEEAIRNVGNKAMADKYLSAGIIELREVGAKQGLPAEAIAQKERDYVSATTGNMVKQLALKDPLAADAFLKENAGRLTEGDRLTLESGLQESVYAAKGQRNAQAVLSGAPIQTNFEPADAAKSPTAVERAPLPDIGTAKKNAVGASLDDPGGSDAAPKAQTPQGFGRAIGALYGLNERSDGAVLSSFIKRTTGLNVDPSVTPWCAAFVNAVLGASGVKGTGSLAARSFMNFGMSTDNPKPGDIVVLSRGSDPSKGHVGFFQGYDDKGRVMILGGNQGDAVKVSSFDADRVIGFRTAGAVTGDTASLPNYSPEGLGFIQQQLSGITDPREYAATQKAIDAALTSRKKAMDTQRESVTDYLGTELLKNPSLDLMTLPMDMQRTIGASGMKSMMEFQDKLRAHGEPTTDDSTLFDLMTMDPEQLATMTKDQLFQARPKLNNADWNKVSTRYSEAKNNPTKAKEDQINVSSAMSFAQAQLEAVGITTQGVKDGEDRQAVSQRIARFQNLLGTQMEEFKKQNSRAPNQLEIQSIINKMLLPVVIKKTYERSMWNPLKTPWSANGTDETTGFLFETGGKIGNLGDGTQIDINVEYKNIPIDERVDIELTLERVLSRKPSPTEVETAYEQYLLERR